MRAVALASAVALLVLATPAAGGELIRFRGADGTIGLVDHASKLPPGATVLGVSKATETAPPSADDPAGGKLRRSLERSGSRSAGPSSDLPSPASPGSRDVGDYESGPSTGSASWCQRGRSAQERLDRAEERLASAEEAYDRCDDGGGVHECSRSRLDSAERELENAEHGLSQVEADCRSSGCDPGWLRCR